MTRRTQWLALVLMLVIPQLSGCQKSSATKSEHANPAQVEKVDGSAMSRLTLSEDAMKRLDLKTGKVTDAPSPRKKEASQRAVPYGAVIYDPQGKTWVYTNPKPRTFIRQNIEVDYIDGDLAFLTEGPPAGTEVATVGVAELYGTEFKVGH